MIEPGSERSQGMGLGRKVLDAVRKPFSRPTVEAPGLTNLSGEGNHDSPLYIPSAAPEQVRNFFLSGEYVSYLAKRMIKTDKIHTVIFRVNDSRAMTDSIGHQSPVPSNVRLVYNMDEKKFSTYGDYLPTHRQTEVNEYIQMLNTSKK